MLRNLFYGVVLLSVVGTMGAIPTPPEPRAPATLNSPNLISPPSGAETTGNPNDPDTSRLYYPPLGVPTFQWEPVSEANMYRLEISPNETFEPMIVQKDVIYTAYTPTYEDTTGDGFVDEDTFFWRVRARDPADNTWSDPSPSRSFVRNWGYTPQLASPSDNTTLGLTPTFEWEPVMGAKRYRLEVSTEAGFPGDSVASYFTPMTSYTPIQTIPNDKDLWWRVRAEDMDGNTGPWSDEYEFALEWGSGDERAKILAPLQVDTLATNMGVPVFSWTPVPGAAGYKIIVNYGQEPDLEPFAMAPTTVDQTTFTFRPGDRWQASPGYTYWWHVQPLDRQRNQGEWNNGAFRMCAESEPCTPQMYYPLQYYEKPVDIETFVDRTIAIPTFMWSATPDVLTHQLQVATDQNFGNVVWEVATENISATPVTTTNPFMDGQIYWWRVRAYTEEDGWKQWSERWKTRIDTGLLMTPTMAPPQPLRPTYKLEQRPGGASISSTFSYEALDHWPNFEWKPVYGATKYRIQISDDPEDFSDPIDEAETMFTNYTPMTKYPWGTYYWRVRAEGGTVVLEWSDVQRVIVERPFQDVPVDPLPIDGTNDFAADNLLASDPAGDVTSPYDLEDLYVGLTTNHWNIGLDATTSKDPVRYGVFIDTNHGDELGAATAPPPEPPASGDPLVSGGFVKAHYPEHAVVWDVNGGEVATATLYTWDYDEFSQTWGWVYDELIEPGGMAAYSDANGFLELAIPRGTFYFQGGVLAYSLSFLAFSADPSTGEIKDTVPSNVTTQLGGFRTDNMSPSPIMPPANPTDGADSIVHRYTPVFAWHFQPESCVSDYGYGQYVLDVASDYDFSSPYQGYSNVEVPKREMLYACHNSVFAAPNTFADNPSYFWRLHGERTYIYGHSMEFTKVGFTPVNRRFEGVTEAISGTVTYIDRTPTFKWGQVEGAAEYVLEVEGPLNLKVTTMLNTYTSQVTFPNGSYRWRVAAKFGLDRRVEGSPSEWISFHKVYTTVTPLSPLNPGDLVEPYAFSWKATRDAAYYEMQIAADRNFSKDVNTYKTFNTTFTPSQVPSVFSKGLGEFYWRVRLWDGDGRPGDWVSLNLNPRPHALYLPAVLKDQ